MQDDKREVGKKIRAQGVEQSDLERKRRAERTNLPISPAEKAKLLFLEPSFVTTCYASAVHGYKSCSFQKTLCSDRRRKRFIVHLLHFNNLVCVNRTLVCENRTFSGLELMIISFLVMWKNNQSITQMVHEIPKSRKTNVDALKLLVFFDKQSKTQL